ncbi:chemotaxis protein CheW [Dehalococcoidia bacterium]|nr:chemotaxis protein CheW [Dehalococcoidia bacterium]
MDIVRRNVEAFNGTIHVETRVGVGTKFRLKLPLTLATFQGLLVSSNSNIYAIPLVSIVETLALESEEIDTVAQKEVIRLRDRIIPLLRLDTLLGVSTNGSGRSGKVHVVVVKSGERIMGLAVDSLNDPQEVMVKSLGSLIGEIKGISGASILGNGEVALILDVPSLVRFATMGKAEG